jgi:hypothetical protein
MAASSCTRAPINSATAIFRAALPRDSGYGVRCGNGKATR